MAGLQAGACVSPPAIFFSGSAVSPIFQLSSGPRFR